MRVFESKIIYSPSDLIRFLESPFASWMDRLYLEDRTKLVPDEETEDQKLIAETGNQHEKEILDELRVEHPDLIEIPSRPMQEAFDSTRQALESSATVVYQAALKLDEFAGFSDFLIRADDGRFQVWDTKLARKPKPYYAIQLCCYSEMLAAATDSLISKRFGIILGTKERVEFRTEDFIHLYRRIKTDFLEMQRGFTGDFHDRPEPMPGADHGRWSSHAEQFFLERDHLVQVAGISVGQIKKLNDAGVASVAELSKASGAEIPGLAADMVAKLSHQARLQVATREARATSPEAPPALELLSHVDANGSPIGLGTLPARDPGDVYFDIEGFPLVDGGLEYLFGICFYEGGDAGLVFRDWWAHDRGEEKTAFEGFVDWCTARWQANPRMHIYHYAAYEVSAVRRLSIRHDTRQEEVDALLRAGVFVDLYQVVRRGLRIGEESYSIKKVERLYRPGRATDVATAVDSIVQYAHWIESGQGRDWENSGILRDIRDYNKDDCDSTAELFDWLSDLAEKHGIPKTARAAEDAQPEPKELPPEAIERRRIAEDLRAKQDEVSLVLADLIDFHRREEKPVWWRMFDRAVAEPETLRDDPGCIEGVTAVGEPIPDKRSLVQRYRFDPAQECKLAAGKRSQVMFSHNLEVRLNLVEIDPEIGEVDLKLGVAQLNAKLDGQFPDFGSLIPQEYVSATVLADALTSVADRQLSAVLPDAAKALLNRKPPASTIHRGSESALETASRITGEMSGDCLVIQGPPGTGKTYTASRMIAKLLRSGKRVGVTSNSHRAVVNILQASGEAMAEQGQRLMGIKVGGESNESIFTDHPGIRYVESGSDTFASYQIGIVGGTAWLFCRPDWEDQLDFLFIDEAGQVSLANAVAMSRCAKNLVLLGDQMQLEQPVQGAHPGDASLSALQYALKDTAKSKEDAPVFHAVVPGHLGIFLGETRRMHPSVCGFISESIYEGRLRSHEDCARQRISIDSGKADHVAVEAGIVFSPVEHEANIQQSPEEVQRVLEVFSELDGRKFTDKGGVSQLLKLEDFLFIAPYNAQVRAMQTALPDGARVASVDKFQGQEAPVCILSLCSSFGEYGSRGLGFILDQNRANVAISRAQCLAVVVGDPRIANSPIHSLSEMKLLNLFCKLLQVGDLPD